MKKASPSVVITSNLYKPNIGGVENSLHHLAKSYLDRGIQPVIVTSDIAPKDERVFSIEYEKGIHIFRYSMDAPRFCLGIKLPKVISGIMNAVDTYKLVKSTYNIKYVVGRYHYNIICAKLAGLSNLLYLVPGVVKFQNSNKNIEKSSLVSQLQWMYHVLLQNVALRLCDRVSVFSLNMIKQVKAVYDKNQEPLLTKPGVDETRFYPINRQLKLEFRDKIGSPTQGRVFLCVGRCVKAKGFDLAIRAFQSLKGTNDKLWIVGDGPLLQEYEKLVKELQLEPHVTFFGRQSEPENFYKAADYFVMSSIYEPLGQTILEGLSSGLPIIAFKPSEDIETASLEILSDDTGVFVDFDLDSDLAIKFKEFSQLSSDEYERVSNQCEEHARNHFSWNSLADSIEKEFQFEK